jgi:hypothetical protein
MSFEHDAFISYAHLDNEPLLKEQQGWVTVFDQALTHLLGGFLGKKVKVWRDPKIAGNDDFSEEIVSKFPQVAVLVSILSPRYVQSEWCTREITRFCEAAEQNHGLTVGDKYRIFKVMKNPVGKDAALPEPVREVLEKMLGYKFYELNEKNNNLETFDPLFGERPREEFLALVLKLAWEMSQTIEKLSGVAAAKAKPLVYLADCARDRRETRNTIEAELKRLGYTVLPERDLPREEANTNVRGEREASDVSRSADHSPSVVLNLLAKRLPAQRVRPFPDYSFGRNCNVRGAAPAASIPVAQPPAVVVVSQSM